MRVLVLGGGGREHAICYMLSKSPLLTKLYCIPGNGGISEIADIPEGIKMLDFPAIRDFCRKEKIDLVVPGPEEPLVRGIRDFLEKEGIRVFGPNAWTAMLEGSKSFAKEIMKTASVPTAEFKVFDNFDDAWKYVLNKGVPLVIKADGLCAGKGVFVCETLDEAREALKNIFIEKIFGDAGSRVVIEEKLLGEEASYIVITDGHNFRALPTSQDHKRLLDNDEGPNTGGMGAYSPAPLVTEELRVKIEKKIVEPILKILRERGNPYLGFLYAGLMISQGEPYVLEFNCRLGDPEAQAILPRLDCDFLELILATFEGKLERFPYREKDKACVCVVIASKGYPGAYEKNKEIFGLEKVKELNDVIVFHAGTRREGNRVYTNGGRVLGVTALGDTIPSAIEKAYSACKLIHFDGAFYRKDIGQKALKYL